MKAFPYGEGGGRRPTERVSKVGSIDSHDCNGEGNLNSLQAFALTILHIVPSYLRHPLLALRYAPRLSSPEGRGSCMRYVRQ